MNGNNGAIDLSAPKTARVGGQLSGLLRRVDDTGTLEVPVRQTPNGLQPACPREAWVDAEQLVEMIRVMVREEIAAALAGGDA